MWWAQGPHCILNKLNCINCSNQMGLLPYYYVKVHAHINMIVKKHA